MSLDSRAFNQLRPVRFELDYVRYPEGSVLIHMGDTQVLCNATVEERLPRWLYNSPKRHGWVTAEYAMLPRSTQTRTQRELQKPRGRTQEIQRLIGRSLRSAVNLDALGERQILIDCDVIQADGGTRTAAITGGYVALALAVKRLAQQGKRVEGALIQPVAAVSVGLVAGEVVLDLDYERDLAADVDMNVVMVRDGNFVEVQGTAEGKPFSPQELTAMLSLADQGIRQLIQFQEEALSQAQ